MFVSEETDEEYEEYHSLHTAQLQDAENSKCLSFLIKTRKSIPIKITFKRCQSLL